MWLANTPFTKMSACVIQKLRQDTHHHTLQGRTRVVPLTTNRDPISWTFILPSVARGEALLP